jgi:predicted acylesterase/phospholipase RssA/CRP-like cAMP-binding protein
MSFSTMSRNVLPEGLAAHGRREGTPAGEDPYTHMLTWLPRYFGDLPRDQLTEISARLRREEISSGDLLYREGDVGDCMHFVLTGRLEVRLHDESGRSYAAGHLSASDSVGELSLLTGNPRAADVVAIRDSSVARLTKQDYEEIVRSHPEAGLNIARFALRRLNSRAARFVPLVTNIAIVPLHPSVATGEFGRRLELALMRFGSTLYLDAPTIRRRTSRWPGAEADGFALDSVLDVAENSRRFVIYEADREDNSWTRKCLSQADRVLLLADASQPPDVTEIEKALFGGTSKAVLAEKELILLRPMRDAAPSGTGEWLAARQVQRHSNVAWEGKRDFNHLARLLSGHAVTLVLGGGGARGFVQIGIIRAIREARVPIDAVGGTSIGAIIGALVALGWDDERILRSCKRAFVDDRPLDDFTFPLFALLRGEKLGRTLRRYMGDVDIVDLWLPYFCVSTNLSRGRMEAHYAGSLWRAVQASATLPGILPPVIKQGELHVDGGVLDNLPVGVMKRFVGGNTIAVSASVAEDYSVSVESFPTTTQYLRSRLMGRSDHANLPTLSSLLIQTTTLGSSWGAEELQQGTDLHLTPPIESFDWLEWRSIYELVDIGYRYACEKLPSWISANPGVQSRDGML